MWDSRVETSNRNMAVRRYAVVFVEWTDQRQHQCWIRQACREQGIQ